MSRINVAVGARGRGFQRPGSHANIRELARPGAGSHENSIVTATKKIRISRS
jgi:hypothetical protein